MIPYYITILIVALFAIAANNGVYWERDLDNQFYQIKTNSFRMFSFATSWVLIVVAGLRYRVGADYGNYIVAYANRSVNWLSFVKNFDEPGLAIICKISSMLHDDYATMFFLASLLTVGLYVHTIKKYSTSYFFAIMMFIFCGTWAGSFGAIRQYLAAAVIFAGHRYMYERKFLKYVVVILVAMLFHRTAIVMLPIYFIASRKINVKTILLLFVATVAVRYSYDYIFSVMSSYKGTDQTQYAYMLTDVNIFRILVAVAPIGLYFLTYGRWHPYEDSETEFYSMLLFVNAAFLLATSNSAYLARVGIFTETFTVFAFPKLLENDNNRKSWTGLILILYFLYFSYQIYSSPSLHEFLWIFNR